MVRRLGELMAPVAPAFREGRRPLHVHGVTCDSRQVRRGYVFVAVRGTRAEGWDYAKDAVRRGCVAIVAERPADADPGVPVVVVPDARAALGDLAARFYGDPTWRLNVVGVTGTKGKSTTTYLLRSIFQAAGERTGLMGTIQYAVDTRAERSPLTTPSAEELQRAFAAMVSAGCTSAAIEASSIALDQQRTRAVRFAAAIFTNLQRDHLDYHRSWEAYREAKARLFEQVVPKGIAAVNADDPEAEFFARRSAARVVRFALDRAADVTGVVEEMTFRGLRLRASFAGEELVLAPRLVGRHNASNILAAAATAWAMGYAFEHIKAGVEALDHVPGRLEPVEEGQPFSVLVDYAHTEESLRRVLECLRELKRSDPGRLILVFGCGGDRDRGKRPRMARAAEELSDVVILTSDNPRSEDPLRIFRDIEAGFSKRFKRRVEPDRAAAIRGAVDMARPGDVVLIAGKGHETYQIVGDVVRPFDDRVAARDALRRLARRRGKERTS